MARGAEIGREQTQVIREYAQAQEDAADAEAARVTALDNLTKAWADSAAPAEAIINAQQAIADNATEAGRSLNRRVEIVCR